MAVAFPLPLLLLIPEWGEKRKKEKRGRLEGGGGQGGAGQHRREVLGSSRRRASASILLDQQPRLLLLRRQLHVGRQTHHLQRADHHPCHVKLRPLQAMPRRELERVVVVVPPFAKGQDADPPVVPREVARVVGLRAPDVADAVDEPRDLLRW